MNFYRPKRAIPAVPIVALIDILAILLIFIVVTTQERKKRTVLPIRLPLVESVATEGIVEPRSVIALAADGSITLDTLRVSDGALVDHLRALRNIYPNRKLELEADESVPFKEMIGVWEALTKAGFQATLPTRVKHSSPTQ